MADLAGRPSVEQVLAVRLDALEHCAIDPFGVGIEAALWTGDTDRVAGEQLGVVAGDAVDGVALGHASANVRWPADEHRRRVPNVPVVGARARLRAGGHLCELRALSAALPDVPGDGRGAVLASRPHRCHAGGRARRAPDRRRVRRLHRDLRAVPGLRDGVPEWGAVRGADGTDTNDTRRRRPDDSLVAAARFACCLGTGCCSLGRRRSPWPTVPARSEATRDSPPATPAPAGGRDDRRRRVALHRLCDGRLATRDASQHGGADRARGRHALGARSRRRLLRCAARHAGLHATQPRWPSG